MVSALTALCRDRGLLEPTWTDSIATWVLPGGGLLSWDPVTGGFARTERHLEHRRADGLPQVVDVVEREFREAEERERRMAR